MNIFAATLPLGLRCFKHAAAERLVFTNRAVGTLVVSGAGVATNRFFRKAFVGSDIDVAIKAIAAVRIHGADTGR